MRAFPLFRYAAPITENLACSMWSEPMGELASELYLNPPDGHSGPGQHPTHRQQGEGTERLAQLGLSQQGKGASSEVAATKLFASVFWHCYLVNPAKPLAGAFLSGHLRWRSR